MSKKAILVGSVGSLKATSITIATFYALKSKGYEIVAMVGASGGSIPLPLLAQDKPIDYVLDSFKRLEGKKLFDQDGAQQIIDWLTPWKRKGDAPFSGWFRGNALRRAFKNLYRDCPNFEDAKIPFSVLTTRIKGEISKDILDDPIKLYFTAMSNNRSVLWNSGSVIAPIRASTAIPLVFRPEKIGEDLYVDGGVVDSIPVMPAVITYGSYDIFVADATTDIVDEPLYIGTVNNVIEVAIASIYTMYKEATLMKFEGAQKILNSTGKNLIRICPSIKIKMGEVEKIPVAVSEAYEFALKVITEYEKTKPGR